MNIDTSIIITNYNNANYIGRAIRSCVKQNLNPKNYEILVVDDASTDNSRVVIDGFKEQVVPIYLDTNVGVAEASNIGIQKALGSLIIRVDSDDFINENTLLFMSELLMKNPDIGFIYSDHLRVDRNENVLERVNLDTPARLFRHGAGVMFRKSYLELVGLYDPTLRNAEDFDLLKRYIKNYDGYHLRLPLYRYRQHETNMTNDKQGREEWELQVKKKHDKNRK